MNESIATLFEAIAGELGERSALRQGQLVRSWAELDRRAASLAGYFVSRGIKRGSTVAIDLFTGMEYLEVVYGAMKARAAPANVNYRYRETELRYLLSDCRPAAVVFDAALSEPVLAAAEDVPGLDVLLQAGGEPDTGRGVESYEAVLAAAAPAFPIPRSKDDLLILYTGGTTGAPKGTLWRHADLFASWSNNYDREGVDRPTTIEGVRTVAAQVARSRRRRIALPAAPMMHATGLFTAMGTLLVGGEVAMLESRTFRPAEVWELVESRRVTELTIVGDAFARPLLEALDAADAAGRAYDLSSLVQIASIGLTWSAALKAALLGRGDFVLVDILASSEGGPYATAVSRRGDRLETSHFTLAPGARLLDATGHDVLPGSGVIGVLATSGPMPDGYLGDEVKTNATFRVIDGVRYAVPGDQATLAADGTLILLGRESGVINSGGEKVFAEEVEQALVSHPGVRDTLVVGVPDDRWGKRVVALVARADPTTVTGEELIAHVGRSLADYKRPRQVIFVPAIQRSPVGKADRRWAERTALEATGASRDKPVGGVEV